MSVHSVSSPDDNISLASSIEDHHVEAASYADQPQMYTSQDALENERLRKQKTREEEVESDEEYLNSQFNESDMDRSLSTEQNINLYLLNTTHDLVGGRHLSVGMDHRPGTDGEEPTLNRPPTNLQRRRSALAETVRRTSTFQSVQKRFHIWDDDFKKERLKVYSGFLLNYIVLGLGFMTVLSIYWGSMYNRNTRFKNMRMLVVIDDQEISSLSPLVGSAVEYTANLDTVKQYGGWNVYNHTDFLKIAEQHDNTIEEEVHRQIHERLYWSAIYVKENATLKLYEKMTGADSSVNVSTLIDAVYESGRDPIAMTSYVVTFIEVFESAFLTVAASLVYPNLLASFSDDELESITVTALTDPMLFNKVDNLPLTSPIIFAPLQLGLVYMIVFAFFQVLLSLRVQGYVAARVKGVKYILFRILTSHVAYIVLGLAYSSLNAAFGLDYTASFGKSGFLVMWAASYLGIASLGCLNENMALICFAYYPPLIGMWLLFLMVSNIAPTFSPMALCPTFYRYGYAMPIHNTYELLKIIFFDGYKGDVGRNVGILVVWMVVSNAFLPITMKHVVKMNKRKAEKAAARGT